MSKPPQQELNAFGAGMDGVLKMLGSPTAGIGGGGNETPGRVSYTGGTPDQTFDQYLGQMGLSRQGMPVDMVMQLYQQWLGSGIANQQRALQSRDLADALKRPIWGGAGPVGQSYGPRRS